MQFPFRMYPLAQLLRASTRPLLLKYHVELAVAGFGAARSKKLGGTNSENGR